MEYYFLMDTNPDSATYDKPVNVARVDLSGDAIVSDYWDRQKGWVPDYNVIRSISGIGGDGWQWKQAKETEARTYVDGLYANAPDSQQQMERIAQLYDLIGVLDSELTDHENG